MQELTKQELRNIIGLEIPTDLAFLYDKVDGKYKITCYMYIIINMACL